MSDLGETDLHELQAAGHSDTAEAYEKSTRSGREATFDRA